MKKLMDELENIGKPTELESFLTTTALSATAATASAAAAANNGFLLQKRNILESMESRDMNDMNNQWAMDNKSMASENDIGGMLKHNWVPITDQFFDACNELNMGELAQDVLFGLFEAMSAIEIMDPKMDVGMSFNKNDAQPQTFRSAVQAGVLKVSDFTFEELIGLFDALLACIVSWLDGNSMDQVLLTCLYLHSPESINDKAVRSFCNAVRCLITLIKNIIMVSNVNEEEDFQLYGNSAILGTDENHEVLALVSQIKDAEDEYVKLSKLCKNPEDAVAVVHRLRFMRHFFQCIYYFNTALATSPREELINDIYKYMNICLEIIPLMKKTIDKGVQADADSELPIPFGFSTRIHDRSQPPTFPRTVKLRDRLSSLQFLEEVIQRLKFACKVIKLKDYYSVLNFFIDFSRKSGQCILSRSILQGLFMSTHNYVFGTKPFKSFLMESAYNFIGAPLIYADKLSFNVDKIHQVRIHQFFDRCVNSNLFAQFIRICGYNRARQRDKLARFIDDNYRLQVEAAQLDSQITMAVNYAQVGMDDRETLALKLSGGFTTWILYNCFRAMFLYLMSGFELELYAVHEYMYIYWYPQEILIIFLTSALQRCENNLNFLEEFNTQCCFTLAGYSKNKKPKPKKNKNKTSPYKVEKSYFEALMYMCAGFFKAMAALTIDGRIRHPKSKFDNEEIRFKRRFSAFANLSTPSPASYLEYKKVKDHLMKTPSYEIYCTAAQSFDLAKKALEGMPNPDKEIFDLLQVAKTNFVVMNVLARGHQKESKTQPEFDFSKHPHYPIIKLTTTTPKESTDH